MSNFSSAAVGFSVLSWPKQIGILLGIAASIALGIYIVLWSKTPDFAPLYAQLDSKDAATVSEQLDKMQVPYRFDASQGGLLVPMEKVNEIRMKLAGLGIPKGGEVGFELFEQNAQLGGSQILDLVRYKRSLEGELTRTINSLEAVKTARVHLGLPKESSFLKTGQKASASVFLELYPGRFLDNEQIMGIVHLVASSIPGLSREAVTVVDQSGRLLNSGGQGKAAMGMALEQFNYVRQIENSYSKRIQELLSPMLGPQGIRAEVTADVDFTYSEEMEEKFNPKDVAVRSESILNEQRGKRVGGGIPGALSNQPPALGTAPEGGNAKEGRAGLSSTPELDAREQATKNYEIGKAVVHTKQGFGKIKRLTVAVVVDDKISYDKKGKETRTKLTTEELEQIKSLVENAIGYSKERGDGVSVLNLSFAVPPPLGEERPVQIWEKSWFWPTVKQAAAGLFLLLMVFVVLRPILRQLADGSKQLSAKQLGFLDVMSQESIPKASAPESISVNNSSEMTPSKAHLEAVKKMSKEDPKKVAHIMTTWVGRSND